MNRSSEQQTCESCRNYAVQLEAARVEIVQLKKRLNELLEEKRIMMNQMPRKSVQLRRKCTSFEQETEPEQLNIWIEPNDLIPIDDTASNDSSISSRSVVLAKTVDEESSGDKSSSATEKASLDEVKLNQASDKILPSSPKGNVAKKRKSKSNICFCYCLKIPLLIFSL